MLAALPFVTASAFDGVAGEVDLTRVFAGEGAEVGWGGEVADGGGRWAEGEAGAGEGFEVVGGGGFVEAGAGGGDFIPGGFLDIPKLDVWFPDDCGGVDVGGSGGEFILGGLDGGISGTPGGGGVVGVAGHGVDVLGAEGEFVPDFFAFEFEFEFAHEFGFGFEVNGRRCRGAGVVGDAGVKAGVAVESGHGAFFRVGCISAREGSFRRRYKCWRRWASGAGSAGLPFVFDAVDLGVELDEGDAEDGDDSAEGAGFWVAAGVFDVLDFSAREACEGGELFLGEAQGEAALLDAVGDDLPVAFFDGVHGGGVSAHG